MVSPPCAHDPIRAVTRIAKQNPHRYPADAEAVVDANFNRIAEALAGGDRVELRGFCTLEVRDQDARSARNPESGETVAVEAKAKVRFKPSKTMRARLNHGEAAPDQKADQAPQAS